MSLGIFLFVLSLLKISYAMDSPTWDDMRAIGKVRTHVWLIYCAHSG